jgi:hypothetical protein
MRRTIVVLAGCLALAGCSSSWQGDVNFKVAAFYDHQPSENSATEKRVKLELVGSLPQDAEESDLKDVSVLESDITGTVGVADGVVCTARHESGETKLSGCRKA